ncbi:polyprenyl synthetase family protein [Tardisphaera saccharovorans]
MDEERATVAALPADVDSALQLVRKRLLKLTSKGRPTLFPAAAHLIKGGGKLVRPSLVLLSCKALGGDPQKASSAAAAVEMIHVASLIQDDLMDGDSTRRGLPAVHAVYGENEAILASDLLIQLAVSEANRLGRRVVAELARAAKLLAQGQELDLKAKKQHLSPTSYMKIARLKTGVLMGCCMAEGAIVAGARPSLVKTMREAGTLFGMAFQIHDDSLDWQAGERSPSNAIAVFGAELARKTEQGLLESAISKLSAVKENMSPEVDFAVLFKASLVGKAA